MDATTCDHGRPAEASFVVPHGREKELPTVASVLRRHAPAFCAQEPRRIPPHKQKVLEKLTRCRQPAMGSHVWHCRWCGNTQVTYNGCNNRHCANCRRHDQTVWVERLLSWVLPIEYLHCVFTLPHELTALILANDAALYRLLFQCVAETLGRTAREAYGVRIGFVMVLHTHGQRMNPHVHIHVVLTAGGLALDETAWVPIAKQDEAISEEALAERFRALYLDGLRTLFRRQKLTMPKPLSWIREEADLERWLTPVLEKSWRVHVQRAPEHCRGPEAVINYLASYVVGTAIRDERVLRHDGRSVVIAIKNYRTGRLEERRMTGDEFVQRLSFHILPDRFLRVRYAGLFGAKHRRRRLDTCRRLLGASGRRLQVEREERPTDTPRPAPAQPEPCAPPEPHAPEPYAPDCRSCGVPRMDSRGILNPSKTAELLVQLRLLARWLIVKLSSFDIDPSTRTVWFVSRECVAPSKGPRFTVLVGADIDRPLPLPDT